MAETIDLLILGLYHPRRRIDINLLPLADPRYRFHLLAPDPWTGSGAEMAEVLDGDQAGEAVPPSALLPLVQPNVVQSTPLEPG